MTVNKENIYKQIDDFNNQPLDPSVANSKPVAAAYLYVNTETANDCALFFSFVKDKKNGENNLKNIKIADLAYGSGNLTSHIVLDNIPDFNKIIFNDINDKANSEIINNFEDDKAEISKISFLEKEKWDDNINFDVVIFNPQYGKIYREGDSKLEKTPVIVSDKSFEEYLKEEKIDTTQLVFKYEEDKIRIHSDTINDSDLGNLFSEINIFNYKDVFYRSKKATEKGKESNIVKFRATLNKIIKPDGIVIFYGELNTFNSLFADYNTVYEYERDKNNLYIAFKKGEERKIEKYVKNNGGFELYKDRVKGNNIEGEINTIQGEIGDAIKKLAETSNVNNSLAEQNNQENQTEKQQKEYFKIDMSLGGNIGFEHKNILLKGVPGTGKSRLINIKLLKEIGLETITHENILRINVHSASSNADLMQGIGLSTNKNNQIEYNEKQGLILHYLKEAIRHPNQAYAIVLEEIQENSLNELIGDLIYLIEDEKRADVAKYINEEKNGEDCIFEDFENFIDELINFNSETYFVQIPYLVSTVTKYRKLIVPKNLYFFCTSNYRDDKKIIEDNLLRRFTLIELYPKEDVVKNEATRKFFKKMNESILKHFSNKEIHPDRLLIGHAYWMKVEDEKSFYQALIKTITEFKDIRELEFNDIKPVFDDLKKIEKWPFGDSEVLKGDNYKEIIHKLQQIAFDDLLNEK